MKDEEIITSPINNRKYKVTRRRCDCECHQPGKAIMHFMACCNEGWVESYQLLNDDETIDSTPLFHKLNIIVPKEYIEFAKKYPKI